MNGKFSNWLLGLILLAGVPCARAQLPGISSFSQNGLLTATNLPNGSSVTVAWASTLAGPWQSNWSGLTALSPGSNGTLQLRVPMFYRLLVVATNATVTNSPIPAGMALVPAGTFTMGDTQDGESDAMPTNITVSAFYMDTNLVRDVAYLRKDCERAAHGCGPSLDPELSHLKGSGHLGKAFA